MKSQNIFAVLLAAIALVGMAFTTVVDVTVDTTESYVAWKGYKVTGEHAGTISVKNGNFITMF